MEFTTNNLLNNACFSAKLYRKFEHYNLLINLSKGLIPHTFNAHSVDELKKLNFKIDPSIDYVTNIFDYQLYLKDNNPDTIHVVDAASKQRVGTLCVDFGSDTLQLRARPLDDNDNEIQIE